MSTKNLYCVIMAGGSGTRFWPVSRAERPKQFLPISGGQPMIAETRARLEGLVPDEQVIVVTAESQRDLVREALPELPPENVLAEPEARNTAPCVAWAAQEIARRDPDAIQVVLPADHVIRPIEAFAHTIRRAAEEASREDILITFGIEPDHPATGYGYIERGDLVREGDGAALLEVARFVEKPDLERAKEFLASGRFLWNSGMFVWSTRSILNAFREHQPAIAAGLDELAAGADLAEVYGRLPKESVDTGIMERAANVRVMPIDYGWSDVGSWAALHEVHETDGDGHVAVLAPGAELVSEDATGCVLWTEEPELIALVGVENLVVVRAGTRTLVCPRDRAQDVKRVVERLSEGKSPFS